MVDQQHVRLESVGECGTGLLAVRCASDRAAELFQQALHRVQYFSLVIDDHDVQAEWSGRPDGFVRARQRRLVGFASELLECQGDAGAAARSALQVQIGTEQCRCPLDDRQAQAESQAAIARRIVHLVKLFEYADLIGWCDADSGVGDGHH